MRQYVRTDQGAGWIGRSEPLVRSGSIFINLTPARLQLEGKTTVLPAGTCFVRSRDLTRRTSSKPREERRTHLIVEEGLHHLERLCYHVRSSERADHGVMVERHEDIAVVAKELFECGQMTFDDHARLTMALAEIRTSFDEHKKNEHKQTVRKRIDTVSAQRSRAGRFKPAPAALTAFASTAHIRRRIEQIIGIHAAFSAGAVASRAKLDEVKRHTSAVWVDLQPKAPVLEIIETAMDNTRRSRVLVNIALRNVDTFEDNLKVVTAMPYRPLAELSLYTVNDLRRNIKLGRVKPVQESLDRLRYLLRRMRMLWFVERSLIHILSFLPDDGDVPTALMQTFRERLGNAEQRVSNMEDAEFDPELRLIVQEYFRATRTNLKDGGYERAREELKHLTRDLRTQPLHPPARRKAA